MKEKKRKKLGFTLIELIVVMAVIGILVLLATPKFLGYTERARETKHVHTAKVIETALEAYLINGEVFPDDLDVVDITLLKESASKETLIGVGGYVTSVDEEVYYELTYDFIQMLDVKLSAKNALLIEANASSVPTAVYASEKGIALVDKEKTMKGYELRPGELPNEIKPIHIKQVVTGGNHTLIIRKDGTVWAWGRNTDRQLGDGTTTNSGTPVKVQLPQKIKSISAGFRHSIALGEDGTVYTWGYNGYGQLGNGTTNNPLLPIPVLFNVKEIATGSQSSFAIKEDSTLWAWGMNDGGQLGTGTYTHQLSPVQVLDNVKKVKGGAGHFLIIREDNTLWACGINTRGELGIGNQTTAFKPVKVLDEVKDIAAGANYSMALKMDGSLWTWGDNAYGQIGNGRSGNSEIRLSPTRIYDGIKSMGSSWYHALAISEDNTLLAWGNGTGYIVPTPILSNVELMAAGHSHSVAISKESDYIWTWGRSNYGELGNNVLVSNNGYDKAICVINKDGSYFNINE